MKIFIGLILAGLLACATAQTQNEPATIAQLADVAATRDVPDPQPTHKTTQSVLQAVEAVVASLTPGTAESTDAEPAEHEAEASEAVEGHAIEAETPEVETSEDVVPEVSEAEEPVETEAPAAPVEESEAAEEIPEETPTNVAPTKKELKAIAKYNEAVDQILVILGERLNEMGPIPLMLNEDVLLALEAQEEPEPEVTTAKALRKNKNKNKKNKKNKRKNQKRKTSLETTSDNNNSQEKNNKNKNKNKSTETKSENSGEKKNKNKKNKNRKNKNKKNNKRKNRDDVDVGRRQPKASDDDDYMEDDELVEEGRRKNEKSGNNNRKNNKKNNSNKKNKNRSNKKNKNNKNKNKNKNNKGRLDMESREADLPTIPTAEERAASNAKMTGFNRLQRSADVTVDLSGKKQLVDTEFTIGPLEVNLKDKSISLTRAKVSTNLTAAAQFKVKNVRGRSKITLHNLAVSDLEQQDVSVGRDDLVLEPEVIAEAQSQVVQSVDIERIDRILTSEIKNILDKDNIVENLENHAFHKKN